jgi:hypothetical protein
MGLLRQNLRDRLLQFWRQLAGCDYSAEIRKQRRQAVLLGRRGLRYRRDRGALRRRQHVPRRRRDRRPVGRCIDQRLRRQRHRVGGSAICALPDHSQPNAVLALRHRKLQRLPFLQRDFREHVDRQARDRDPHQIGGQHFHHLRIDHGAGLQHKVGRDAADLLGGKHGQDGFD